MAREGTGATITFATSAYTAEWLDIQLPDTARDPLETTHLGTTTAKTFQPAKLYDPGEVSVTVHHDPSLALLISSVAEVITVTYPLETGESTAATAVFTGFVTGQGGETFKVGELIATKLKIKVTGAIAFTAGS